MAWDAGTITNAAPWAALSQKLKDLISSGSNVGNWSFEENVPAGTGIGQSGSASYALDVFLCRGASVLYKRTVQKNLANSQITTDGTSFAHAVITPATNKFISVTVFNTKASAADDPTGVTLNGSNAPTFTKIKSQASGGGSAIVKGTLWIAKTGGSAPTGTTLTVAFGATQTGCIVIVDEWDGIDLSLAANGVGAGKIVRQVVGNNGTNELAHSATLAALEGAGSVCYIAAAETASIGTYTAGVKAGWTPLAADLVMATPNVHARGSWRPDADDPAAVMTHSSATAMTDWAAIAVEFRREILTSSITDANDAGQDWRFIIEIPTPDGAVTSSFNCCENYNNKMFRRMPPTASATVPVGSGYWRDDTLIAYATVPGNPRALAAHQALNTTGFSYWIKLTKNGVMIGTRVSSSEATNGAMLLDSVITNATDLPLISVSPGASAASNGNSFSRLPGVAVAPGTTITGWQCAAMGWTSPTQEGFTTNAANQQDLWASRKIHDARIFVGHSGGRLAGNSGANDRGYARGLWKTDYRCLVAGGTVQLGDLQAIEGVPTSDPNPWTVIYKGFPGSTGTQNLVILTRAN
jgi:hypothetical protein